MKPQWLLLLCLAAAGCKKKAPVAAGEVPSEAPASEPVPSGEPVATEPAAPGSPVATAGAQSARRIDEAVALLTKGSEPDALRARQQLETVLASEPESAAALFNLGVALYQLGDVEGAATTFSKLTRLDPSSAKAWLYLGLTERSLGDVDASLRRFKSGIALAPDDMDLRVAIIQTLRRTGRSQEAVAEAKEALRVNTRSLTVYSEMGQAYLELGQLDLARFVFEKARTIPGGEASAELEAYFGRTNYLLGQRYVAKTLLESAVQRDPSFVPAMVFLAQCHLDDHAYELALPLLERASAAVPRHQGVWVNLGTAYRGVGRTDDAARAWRQALAVDPKNPDPHFNLGIMLGDDLKDYPGAIGEFKAYLDGGGAQTALTQEYLAAIEKEQEKTARRRAREDEKAKRAAEQAERERVLREAERDKGTAAPEGEQPNGPWGPTGGGQLRLQGGL
jgi:tetratricopeptide (TPR) repeat protein